MITAKTFYMIRHGQSVANEAQYFSGNLDVALTDLGRTQADEARQIVEAMADEHKPTYIYHSHLQRARNTAKIINTNLGLPMSETPLLGEQHFGDWEGQSWDDYDTNFRNDHNPPNGETNLQFAQRVRDGLNLALKQDGLALVSCHGGVFKSFSRLYDLPAKSVKNCVLYKFIPAPDNEAFPWVIEEMS